MEDNNKKVFIIYLKGMAGEGICNIESLVEYSNVKKFINARARNDDGFPINSLWPSNLITKIEGDILKMPDSIRYISLPKLDRLCIATGFYDYFIENGHHVLFILPTDFDNYEKMAKTNARKDNSASEDVVSKSILRQKGNYTEYMNFIKHSLLCGASVMFTDCNVEDILNGEIDNKNIVYFNLFGE